MEITWLGHSCFRLRLDELSVITDPFPDSIGIQMGNVSAIAVTVSNTHPNHSYWSGVEGTDKVLDGPGEYELSGVYVRGIMTPQNEGDPLDQRNTAYMVEMEGLSLCHLGDIKAPLTTRQAEQLKPVDVLFLPVGSGECTLELSQAIQLMHVLSPKLIFPMHYGLPGLQAQVGDLEPFIKEMAIQDIQAIPRINVTASSLPAEPRVVLLQAQGVQTEL
mgnify:CR=1 FL=1